MDYEMQIETLQPTATAVVTATLPVAGIGPFVGEAFGLVMQALQAQHAFPVGPPFARYRMHGDTFEVSAGFPVAAPITAADRVVPASLPGGQVASTVHLGAYDEVSRAYDAILAWLPTQHLAPAGDPWEQYLDGPEVAQPRTLVHLPVAPA